ncbi:MAG TPA: PP2C family protein-serine/threonine phosphatase [Bryobacteraceae bacterium]|jgi:serine phosphatase RsbU (regulator of sigma subunit)|nr:PP2C family protein-serine/threonine phosphatase [Bryobacteraceae bacterium]
MSTRVQTFWRQISDGIAIQQLWLQFQSEARASYRLYSREVDWTRGQQETRGQRFRRIVRGLFWAMVLKLSPARRVLFVVALVLLVFPGLSFNYHDVQLQMPNLAFFSAILFLVLLALELADRVTMKRDLEIAKEIQSWLMPAAPPQVPGIDIAFATRPANTVAGDYYDAFLRTGTADPQSSCPPLLLVVADVAGKSVPAALLMATLQASLRTLAGICTDTVELIERLNRYACDQNVGGKRFTTAFLAELDPATRQLTYVNAGHNWPVLRRVSGGIERLQTGGLPLGLMRNARYECGRVTLAPGDLLLVFTDGLVEAENDSEEEYGEGRMFVTLNSRQDGSAADVLRDLMSSADGFVGFAPQHDDITCLVLRTGPAT